jgi:hypothetical protein
MAVNVIEIQLTDEQKQRIARLAEQLGKPWTEVLEERLSSQTEPPENGTAVREDGSRLKDINGWLIRFDNWMSQCRSYNPNVDDSRESIYPDRW